MAANSLCRDCGTRLGPEDNDGPITQPDACSRCRARAAAASKPDATPFETMGRQRFVLKMVEVIDRNALAQDPPINPYDQAGRIVLAALGWDDLVWKTIARRANPKRSKSPSAKSRQMLIDVYRGRATAPIAHREAS